MKNKIITILAAFVFVAVLIYTEESAKDDFRAQEAARSQSSEMEESIPPIKEISAMELKGMMERGEDFVLIDVREKSEYDEGHIKGATLIPRESVLSELPKRYQDRSTTMVFYCAVGGRSSMASGTAHILGYANVMNFKGSFAAWKEKGYEIVR